MGSLSLSKSLKGSIREIFTRRFYNYMRAFGARVQAHHAFSFHGFFSRYLRYRIMGLGYGISLSLSLSL